jgi:spore coat protein A, manganese oxidase
MSMSGGPVFRFSRHSVGVIRHRTLRRFGTALAVVPFVLAFAPTAARPAAAPPTECGPSPVPTLFTDAVAQPPVARPDDRAGRHYTLTAQQGVHRFSSQWPAVPTLGYTADPVHTPASYLGPTIVTTRGTPIDVTLVNGLGTGKLFPFDPPFDRNEIVMHRHGGLQAATDDGSPAQKVFPGGQRTNHYPNTQAAAPLWYHDHADLVTSYRVYEGLAGFMPNTDRIEGILNRFLPSGDFAKAYVLQDKRFNPDYTLCYTHAQPEFFGDLPVVNGTIAPYQRVEPRHYTFTFINGSDSRFYRLSLTGPAGVAGPQMTVIGSDSGYVARPAEVDDLLIAPGERYKVVVDFTGHASQQWVLHNDAAEPFPDGDEPVGSMRQLMRFDVGASLSSRDRTFVPPVIPETNNLTPVAGLIHRARLRTLQADETSPGVPLLGDASRLRFFDDPATETPQLGSKEVWAIRNASPDAHPIHEHLVELRLVGRWHVGRWIRDPDHPELGARPDPTSIGPFEPPGAWESGPKDTFVAPKDFITAWVGRYTIGGTSVWHCHILSHEDAEGHEMMRPLVVGDDAQTQLPLVANAMALDRLIRRT